MEICCLSVVSCVPQKISGPRKHPPSSASCPNVPRNASQQHSTERAKAGRCAKRNKQKIRPQLHYNRPCCANQSSQSDSESRKLRETPIQTRPGWPRTTTTCATTRGRWSPSRIATCQVDRHVGARRATDLCRSGADHGRSGTAVARMDRSRLQSDAAEAGRQSGKW